MKPVQLKNQWEMFLFFTRINDSKLLLLRGQNEPWSAATYLRPAAHKERDNWYTHF